MTETREPSAADAYRRESLRWQLLRFKALPLREKVKAVEDMCTAAAFFARKRVERVAKKRG